MTAAEHLNRAAELLVTARRERRQITLPEDCRPTTVEDAFTIQDLVAAKLWPGPAANKRVTAWKTGAASPEAEPFGAPIGPELIYPSGTTLPAADFHMIGIECELVYRFGADLPPIDGQYEDAQVVEAITSIHPAIELVDTRLAAWKRADDLSKLADNQSNGGLVIGDALADWQRIVPEKQRVVLTVNGDRLADTVGGNSAGNPLWLLVWMVNHCAGRIGGLRAGDVITTGSYTGVDFVEPGAQIVADFPGIGQARISFAA